MKKLQPQLLSGLFAKTNYLVTKVTSKINKIMKQNFNNRVYGFAIIKSINSNYNADFSGQPRKLPSGKVYATDKALKYSIRNYWKNALGEKVFYFKSLSDDMSPRTLDETYELHFGKMQSTGSELRKEILRNILKKIRRQTIWWYVCRKNKYICTRYLSNNSWFKSLSRGYYLF